MKKKIIIISAAVFCFVLITCFVYYGISDRFDDTVCSFFYSIRTDGLNTLMEGITYLGNWQSVTVLCLLLLAYGSTRNIYGIPAAAAALTSSAVKAAVKPLMKIPRPDASLHLIEQGGYSYPSGHAITSMTVCLVLFILVKRHMEGGVKKNVFMSLLIIVPLMIGISRVYLGVHFPTDVLGGWSAAAALAAGEIAVIDRIKKDRL